MRQQMEQAWVQSTRWSKGIMMDNVSSPTALRMLADGDRGDVLLRRPWHLGLGVGRDTKRLGEKLKSSPRTRRDGQRARGCTGGGESTTSFSGYRRQFDVAGLFLRANQ